MKDHKSIKTVNFKSDRDHPTLLVFNIHCHKILIILTSMSKGLSRLPVYVVFGPLAGLICFYVYHSLYFFNKTGTFEHSSDFSLFIVMLAYVFGVLPASITALVVGLIVKKRPKIFVTLRNKILVSAIIGGLTTFMLVLGPSIFTGEMGAIPSSDALSLLAYVIYGTCAGIVCEVIYSKY